MFTFPQLPLRWFPMPAALVNDAPHSHRRWITLLQLACILPMVLLAATADSGPTGLWRTFDDHTGKQRGTVLIYARDGEYFGKIVSSLDPKDATERCTECTDDRKDKLFIELEILRNLKQRGAEYNDGTILDPDTGSIYRCRVRLGDDGRKLSLRGYVGISLLGRSQTWVRER